MLGDGGGYNTFMRANKRVLVLILIILAAISWGTAQAQGTNSQAIVLTADGPLTPVLSEYLSRGLKAAEKENAELLILQLNTPGGSVDLMLEMADNIRNSAVPVVVYVSPRGAIAGSAGTVITLAGHLAAMAPETVIGAASPVGGEGEDIGETMEAKVKEILKAKIRSLAEGRPPEAIAMAEDTVENAKAYTAKEAFEAGMVDIIAKDIPDLLQQLDGWEVETSGVTRTLNTKYIQYTHLKPRLIEEVLSILTNPNIVFLLLTIGVQAVLIELGSPGGWMAGFIGVVSLALAAYGLGILPVNWFGLVFLATAFVLFFLEIKAPTHGVLAFFGVASFIAGALILFNSSETPSFYRVNVTLVVATGMITAATFLTAVAFVIRAQKAPPRTGKGILIGRSGRVREAIPIYGQGKVYLAAEMWTAELAEGEEPLEVGDRVEVVEVEGVRLKVKKKGGGKQVNK